MLDTLGTISKIISSTNRRTMSLYKFQVNNSMVQSPY
jgi:hypothetical protein